LALELQQYDFDYVQTTGAGNSLENEKICVEWEVQLDK